MNQISVKLRDGAAGGVGQLTKKNPSEEIYEKNIAKKHKKARKHVKKNASKLCVLVGFVYEQVFKNKPKNN